MDIVTPSGLQRPVDVWGQLLDLDECSGHLLDLDAFHDYLSILFFFLTGNPTPLQMASVCPGPATSTPRAPNHAITSVRVNNAQFSPMRGATNQLQSAVTCSQKIQKPLLTTFQYKSLFRKTTHKVYFIITKCVLYCYFLAKSLLLTQSHIYGCT